MRERVRVELEGEGEIGKEGLVQVGKGRGGRPAGGQGVGGGRGWGWEGGEGVVKKMGAWTTGKWSKVKREKEGSKASKNKEAGRRAEFVCVCVCLCGGVGLEGGTGPGREGGRPG